MNDTEQELYTSYEVCSLVGITYRQLDWWVRRGIINHEFSAHGSGTHRRWTHDEVLRLKHVVAIYEEAQATIAAFTSGELWRATEGGQLIEETP